MVSQLEHEVGAQYRSMDEYIVGPILLNKYILSTCDYVEKCRIVHWTKGWYNMFEDKTSFSKSPKLDRSVVRKIAIKCVRCIYVSL